MSIDVTLNEIAVLAGRNIPREVVACSAVRSPTGARYSLFGP